MLTTLSRAAVLACAVAVSVSAQAPRSGLIDLRYGAFDPLASQLDVPEALRSQQRQQLHIVQFASVPTQADRDAILAAGGKVIGYLPVNAYVVRMSSDAKNALQAHKPVRWLGGYHPAFRLELALIKMQAWSNNQPVRYNIVVADKHTDKPSLANKIKAIGGTVDNEHTGSLLFTVTLTGPQLLEAAGFDEVLWIDRWSPEEEDVDNARIQGGANYVESQGGYSGVGVNTHIYEGIDAGHQGYSGSVVNVNSGGSSSSHGTNTAGIVFGDGTGNAQFRGLAPDAGKFYTNYSSVNTSRWQVFSDLVNIHNVSHTTASWGNARTFFYTSVSAEADDITFDHDLAWTQSQSNAGNQDSRPQAWAKNIFSIGGVYHGNNSNPGDDSWNGGASIGPASDGRIKPTLTAYYDNIGTTSQGGGYTTSFGGTSGATPIVAGHNVLAIEMFTEEVSPGVGLFGNPMRVPGGTSHQNRPHFPTLKGLQVVSAAQYSFNSGSSNNRREHQGWGFPNLQTMYDNRDKTYIVDETAVLNQGQTHIHSVTVAGGEPSLKVCLNWNEPAGNPSASQQLINNLSLRVTAPNSTSYWGNNGLDSALWSTTGGSEDTINSIENVFVQNPQAGVWLVEVIASGIVQDNHVETAGIDADYGLVVAGGLGQLGGGSVASVETVGSGCVENFTSFYEELTTAGFDLTNTDFNGTNSASGYTVSSSLGSGIIAPGAIGAPLVLPMPDDGQVAIGTLGLVVGSNGWVALGGGNSNSWIPTAATFLDNPSTGLYAWTDLQPNNSGTVSYEEDPVTGNTRTTFDQVNGWNTADPCSLQFDFNVNTGDWNLRIGVVGFANPEDWLVGYSTGGVSADPGSRDLTLASLFSFNTQTADTVPLALEAVGTPVLGQPFMLTTTNIEPTAVFHVGVVGLTPVSVPLQFVFPSANPGCFLNASLDLVLGPDIVFGGPGSHTWEGIDLTATALVGFELHFTSATLDLTVLSDTTRTANGIKATTGVN